MFVTSDYLSKLVIYADYCMRTYDVQMK